MTTVICLGIAVRDYVFSVPALPPQPQKLTATAFERRGGGMAATAAVAIAALGGAAQFWGRLGDDPTGRELRTELESFGVRVRAQAGAGAQTPVATVLVGGNGERMLAVFRGQADATPDWLPLGDVAQAAAVHADFRWVEGACALYAAAIAAGIPRVLDADAGDIVAVRSLLPLADHAIFSAAGLRAMAGHDDVEAGLRAASNLAAGVVGVTLGAAGSVFLVEGELHRIAAPAVVARDTNGAGDVFHGAYALAVAEGAGVVDAARFASAAAALKCRNGSGWEAAPDRAAVTDFMKGLA